MGENTHNRPQDTDGASSGDELFADLAPPQSKRRSALPPPPPPPQPPGGLFKTGAEPQSSARNGAPPVPPSAPVSIRSAPTRSSLPPPPPSKRRSVPAPASKAPEIPKKTQIGLAPPRLPSETSGEVAAAVSTTPAVSPTPASATPALTLEPELPAFETSAEAPDAVVAAGALPGDGMDSVADEVTPLTSASPPPAPSVSAPTPFAASAPATFMSPEPARNVPGVRQSATGVVESFAPGTPPPVSVVPRSTMISEAPPPVALQPVAADSGGKGKLVAMLLGAAVLIAVIGSALLLNSGGSTGSVVIAAEGPGHSPVDKVEIYVDGKLACKRSPCPVADLSDGVHLVRVEAEGYDRYAELPFTVVGGKDQSHIVELTPAAAGDGAAPAGAPALAAIPGGTAEPQEAPPPPAAPAEATPPEAAGNGALSLSDLSNVKAPEVEKASVKEPVVRSPRAPSPRKKKTTTTSKKASAQGTLRMNAIPVSKVLLDGRPIGETPMEKAVSPGNHTVVFISSKGRKSRSVTVDAGKSKVVSVRFK